MNKFAPVSLLAGLAILASGCTTTSNVTTPAAQQAQKTSIDAGVDRALAKLDAEVPGSRELVHSARGVLVFPGVVSAGLVVGGAHGRGALRQEGMTSAYYSTTSASVGWVAGAESKDLFVLFMTDDAMARFQASHGWTAGVDASVTVLKVGADGHVDTQTIRQPVVGFVLTNGGLMVDVGFDGTKFSKITL